MPLPVATTALTAHLTISALAVLAGGFLSAWTSRHNLVAAMGLSLGSLLIIPTAIWHFDAGALIVLMGLSGLLIGVTMPSRDMLVRAVAPPGSFGVVFGFVTTGFNIGAIIAPPIFGAMMDHGAPDLVLVGAACCGLAAALAAGMSGVWGKPRSR